MMEDNNIWYLVGIVSAGYSCAKQYQPGIYHKVSSSSDWVSSALYWMWPASQWMFTPDGTTCSAIGWKVSAEKNARTSRDLEQHTQTTFFGGKARKHAEYVRKVVLVFLLLIKNPRQESRTDIFIVINNLWCPFSVLVIFLSFLSKQISLFLI